MSSKPASPLIREAIERFHATIRLRFGKRLKEFVLFGSHARGDANEDSDVDLLVVVDELDEIEQRQILDMAYDAGATRDELVVLSPLAYSATQAASLRSRERRLMTEIARDGVVW